MLTQYQDKKNLIRLRNTVIFTMLVTRGLKRTYESLLLCESSKAAPDVDKTLRLVVLIDEAEISLSRARDAALKLVLDGAVAAWRDHAAVFEVDMNGSLGLHWAFDAKDVRRRLAAPGWPVSLRLNFANRHGSTPLHEACARGDVGTTLELLASGARFHAKDNKGRSPLDNATLFKRPRNVDAIMAHAAGVIVRAFRERVQIRRIKLQVKTLLLCVRRCGLPIDGDTAIAIATTMYSGYTRMVAKLDEARRWLKAAEDDVDFEEEERVTAAFLETMSP